MLENVLFLGKSCVGKKVYLQSIRGLEFFEYTGRGYDYGRKQENGKFTIISEENIAKETLEFGKGVWYKGYLYFQANKLENNKHYEKFNGKYNKLESNQIKEDYNTYLNGELYMGLRDTSHFAMLKSMITLYEQDIFTLEHLESKLVLYIKGESLQIVLDEIHESRRKAG